MARRDVIAASVEIERLPCVGREIEVARPLAFDVGTKRRVVSRALGWFGNSRRVVASPHLHERELEAVRARELENLGQERARERSRKVRGLLFDVDGLL